MQSVASAHRRLHEVNSTLRSIEIWHGDSSFATLCESHTCVLTINPIEIVALLEIVHGQVLQAIPVLLRMSAEPRRSSMDSGNR